MSAKLAVGEPAPAFSLPGDGGTTLSLDDFRGRRLVLFFYPKADTPGCTLESRAFSKLAADFEASGTALLGASADPVKAQDRFKRKYDLNLPLASDETHEMLLAYDVWGQKSLFALKYMGVERATYLIGPDGKIEKIWRNVKARGHAEEVLAEVKAR